MRKIGDEEPVFADWRGQLHRLEEAAAVAGEEGEGVEGEGEAAEGGAAEASAEASDDAGNE